MKLTENAVAAEVLIHLAWEAQEAGRDRLDGVHVSDIVLCPRKAWYKRTGKPPRYTPDDKILFLSGTGLHAVLQEISRLPAVSVEIEVPARYVTPGVLIHNTVDLLLRDHISDEEIPCEIKSTRGSAGKPVESSSHYIEQIACTCVILGYTRARLYILHLNGDYKTRRTPILACWELEFDPAELARWETEMVRRHDLIVADTPPHPYEAYRWECGYCPYSETKGGPCPGGGLRVPFFINTTVPPGIALDFTE